MSDRQTPINIAILGLESAGKSTLLMNIAGKEIVETNTTIGMDVELIEYKGLTFQAIDIGGQRSFRETLWPHFTTLAKGVIFVFDIFDRPKIGEARVWFDNVIHWLAEDSVLIFLANKVDLKDKDQNYVSTEEIIKIFQLEEIAKYPRRSFRIAEISAKTGQNVKESVSWIFQKISNRIVKDANISFVYIFNQKNELIYKTGNEEQRDEIETVISDRIQQMEKLGAKENYVKLEGYRSCILRESNYSVVIGSSNGVSKEDLGTAAASISNLINSEFYPLEEHLELLETVVNTALIRKKKNERKESYV